MPARTYKEFTIESPGAVAKPGEGLPRRAAYMGDKPLVAGPEGVTTLHDAFLHGVKLAGDKPYLGTRKKLGDGKVGAFEWMTYNEAKTRALNIGMGLQTLGVAPQGMVGLFAINRAEWVLAEQACYVHAFCTVPLYETLGAEAIDHILNQTEMQVCVASGEKAKTLANIKARLPHLRTVVSMDNDVPATLKQECEQAGLSFLTLAEVEKRGADALAAGTKPERGPQPDDLATICYTSGTTGVPKGAMLTHKNFLSAANGVLTAGEVGKVMPTVSTNDIYLSYLPLAHVFERTVQQFLVLRGARIGFFQGDTLKLLEDVAELKPTLFISVPRLFNRIYDKVLAGVKAKGGIAEYLFNTALAAKKSGLKKGSLTHFLWDRLVFGAVRARLGGRVRFLFTGSAPISGDVLEFLRCAFSCDVLEGYGQTETSAGISITFQGDFTKGTIGVPIPCGEVKLRDVPGMNYYSTDKPNPRGEIMARGNQCFTGYYKEPEKTKDTIIDGWVATGDVGMWDESGRLVIIDRVKNIFKLSQGEYVAPEKIEGVYAKHELVAQAFVYGDSLKSSCVGVFVVDAETFPGWAAANGFQGDLPTLCANPDVQKKVLQVLVAHGKASDLKGFEQVRALHLDHDLWSVDNGMLTPTFKSKRGDLKQRYLAQIESMYSGLN